MSSPVRSSPARVRRGISLIASLILMALMAMLALAGARGVVLQTRMSGATLDRAQAFQAAEAALREAERRAATIAPATLPTSGCTNGVCATPALTATPRWQDSSFTGWQAATVTTPSNAPAASAIIENMGTAPNWLGCENDATIDPNCLSQRFRISARSTAEGRASVTVQSQFAQP